MAGYRHRRPVHQPNIPTALSPKVTSGMSKAATRAVSGPAGPLPVNRSFFGLNRGTIRNCVLLHGSGFVAHVESPTQSSHFLPIQVLQLTQPLILFSLPSAATSYIRDTPPSTKMDWPVMYSESSDARKTASFAWSSGCAGLPSGVFSIIFLK